MPEARQVNLDDLEAVKGYIVSQASWPNAYKQGVAYAYNSYAKANGLEWTLPHFRIEDRLPKIPTEEKINQGHRAGPSSTCWRQLTVSAHARAVYLNTKEERVRRK